MNHHQLALKKVATPQCSFPQLQRLYRLAAMIRYGDVPDDSGITCKRVESSSGLIGSAFLVQTGIIVQLVGPASVHEAEQLQLSVSQAIVQEASMAHDGTSSGIRVWELEQRKLAQPVESVG